MNPESKLLFIAATHGNEGYTIPILEKLETNYPKKEWGYDWIIGNPEAYKQNKRYIEADLNRVAPGNLMSKIYEEKRAAEIITIAQEYDMVIDLHGTVAPSDVVKIIPLPSPQNILLAGLFPDIINIIWYSTSSMEKGPLAQYMGKPSIELECDKSSQKVAENLYKTLVQALEIKQVMSWAQMLKNITDQSWYQVVGKIQDSSSPLTELQPFETKDGVRYPFLTNQYSGTKAYALKSIKLEDSFLST